ncbi:hypothetical protein ACMD2_24460 [Ananas comosus]|uniref:Uncharacterized protein n=1 Tax=Ananas comosus TaxID=4615 RepID=A0A199UF42_ANACO|nr:hypothetical protein ACMD2_24460 [Ananas comosus]
MYCAIPSSKKGGATAGKGFTRRCAKLVKEQRARIYILRRCATMLLCCLHLLLLSVCLLGAVPELFW